MLSCRFCQYPLIRCALTFWLASLAGGACGAAEAGPPPLRIVYFVPTDRQPAAEYQPRLDRVMTEVQRFFREGMQAAGDGPKTFALERDADEKMVIHLVRGAHPMATYGRNASAAVRREVKAALNEREIDVDRETIVIFELLLRWDGDKAVEVGPYCGGGSHLAGTAWVYDDERLDPRLLSSKEPGGYYHRPCSLGEFNSHYIGGVAHELGHALSLPHVCQRRADRELGTALMGAGNHTYGEELRREGRGTFLMPTSAMRLANIRAFAGEVPNAHRRPSGRLVELKPEYANGQLMLTGRLEADPPVLGIAGYNDHERPQGNYDAVGFTAEVDAEGRFQLAVTELRPGKYQLRVVACHTSGSTSQFAFSYEVDARGQPQTDAFRPTHPPAAGSPKS